MDGFVTVAFGSEKYYKNALNLLLSYKLTNKSIPFGIITDAKNPYIDKFDYYEIKNDFKCSPFDKRLAFEWNVFDRFIFIESDMIILVDISFLFSYFLDAQPSFSFSNDERGLSIGNIIEENDFFSVNKAFQICSTSIFFVNRLSTTFEAFAAFEKKAFSAYNKHNLLQSVTEDKFYCDEIYFSLLYSELKTKHLKEDQSPEFRNFLSKKNRKTAAKCKIGKPLTYHKKLFQVIHFGTFFTQRAPYKWCEYQIKAKEQNTLIAKLLLITKIPLFRYYISDLSKNLVRFKKAFKKQKR